MDDAEHAFFGCDRWERQRRQVEECTGEDFNPQSVVQMMLKSPLNWAAVDRFVDHVLTLREKEERERQRRPVI